MRLRRRLALLLALGALAGCMTVEIQRATEGPTAEEVYISRFVQGYGRTPTFDETTAFRTDLDQRVSTYLRQHPEVSRSPRVSQFTFQRRVAVGMTKEEVMLLMGPPAQATQEEKEMQAVARQFWPVIKPRAREMWVYPEGWQLYFDGGDRLVDLTVVGQEAL